MELKLLRVEGMCLSERFNRTFMELKFDKVITDCFEQIGFNRTFMELKFIKEESRNRRKIVLIVPLWN